MNLNDETNSIAVVLVNWRQPYRTIEAVLALELQTRRPNFIIVIDNDSRDDSVFLLKSKLPNVIIIGNTENQGFGSGCNLGIGYAMSKKCQYILLLNNDAIPEASLVENMLIRANSDRQIGVVGAVILDPEGNIANHSGSILDPLTFNCRNTVSEEDLCRNRYAWITGAAMLLSATAISECGIFDSKYFMYWEDADLCQRIRGRGFKICIAQNAFVNHVAGTSSSKIEILRFGWHLESQLRWVRKNYSYPIYGYIVIYLRHFVKSILNLNLRRFLMTTNFLFSSK